MGRCGQVHQAQDPPVLVFLVVTRNSHDYMATFEEGRGHFPGTLFSVSVRLSLLHNTVCALVGIKTGSAGCHGLLPQEV